MPEMKNFAVPKRDEPGIRLNVPIEYAGRMMVVQTSREYGAVYLCPTCNEAHIYKHYHLRIGNDGSVIVSRKIYEEMTKADQIGNTITVSNGVANPPAQLYGQDTHVRTRSMPRVKVKKII